MHPIYIGDASEFSSESTIVESANGEVDIHYFHWEHLSDRRTLGRLAKEALKSFKYCAFHGDDDYFMPSSLSEAADFLENNSSYATAQGKAVLFSLDKAGPYGNIKRFGVYWDRKELNGETAKDRLIEITDNYWVPIFSVHRTDEFIEDILNGVDSVVDRNFGEYINSLSIAMRGKSKFIDCLYLIRNVHDRIDHPSYYRWISSDIWFSSLAMLKDELTNTLAEKDDLTLEDAATSVDQSIETLMKPKSDSVNYKLCIRDILRRSGFLLISRKIRKAINITLSVLLSDSMNLENITSKSSKYYNDFMPVLKSLEINSTLDSTNK